MTAKKHPSRFNGPSPSRGLGGLVRDITALDQRVLLILVTVPVALTLFEYVEVAGALHNIARCLAPGAIFVAVLQLPSLESAPVTSTRYKSLELLAPIMNLVSPSAFSNMCKRFGLQQIKTDSIPLKKGKAFFVGFYRRKGMG